MSSVTSSCPALRGSWGGGYEGGVHLFTPREAGAERARRGGQGVEGKGDKEAVQGTKRKRQRREVDGKEETLSVLYLERTQNNTTSSHASTENRH